jgi:hypothetical protein
MDHMRSGNRLVSALIIGIGAWWLTPAAEAIERGRYRGTADVQLYNVNVFTGELTPGPSFDAGVNVLIRDPLRIRSSRQRERNPFNFLITPTAKGPPFKAGSVFARSAFVRHTNVGRFIAEYWDIDQTSSRRFTAVLEDNHSRERKNGEQIYAPYSGFFGTSVLPYALYDGQYGNAYQNSLSGRVSGRRLKIRIEGCGFPLGGVGGGLACFVTKIDARRR